MDNQTPPPLPPQGSPQLPPSSDAKAVYNVFEQKIGGVPNLRVRDNLYQAACIVVCLIVGAVVGLLFGGWPTGAGLGALAGVIGGLFLSGIVLMIIGWMRKP